MSAPNICYNLSRKKETSLKNNSCTLELIDKVCLYKIHCNNLTVYQNFLYRWVGSVVYN